MNRAILISLRDWIGQSLGVINALDRSDTWSAATVGTTDSRIRVHHSGLIIQSQTVILSPSTSEEHWRTHTESGFINVACYSLTLLDGLRIRDAVRRQVQDYAVTWPTISGAVGAFRILEWVGDGAALRDEALQLYRVDGTVGITVQNHT